jgi:prevent-host-death family protein
MRVSASYARQHFASLLEAVLAGGEVSIERHGRPLARLVPAERAAAVPGQAESFPEPRAPKGNSRLERLFHRRALDRFRSASLAAQRALARLRSQGVRARVIGSLARGSFKPTSDVDFLIEDAASLEDMQIERTIRGQLRDMPFDVLYLDRLTRSARDAILKEIASWPSQSSPA